VSRGPRQPAPLCSLDVPSRLLCGCTHMAFGRTCTTSTSLSFLCSDRVMERLWHGSRHPTPPRMKKRWAEPPRDQPGANSHASCSPAERRQETAGARPAAMAELRLLYVLMSRSRWRPQEMAGELGQPPWLSTRQARARGEATPPMLPRVWPSGGTRRRRELDRPPCPSAHGARARGDVYRVSPRPAERRQ
jgi:hypothetical protein